MQLDFIEEIYEARMTRNSSDVKKLTYNDCCEKLYLSLLVLELLRKYPRYVPIAMAYGDGLWLTMAFGWGNGYGCGCEFGLWCEALSLTFASVTAFG